LDTTGSGPWTFTNIQRTQLIGQGTTPNQNVQTTIHFTINANGDTTAEVIMSDFGCAPPQQ
jgi:hypothetical protein